MDVIFQSSESSLGFLKGTSLIISWATHLTICSELPLQIASNFLENSYGDSS